MKVYHTTQENLDKALAKVNKKFDNNIIYNRYPEALNKKRTSFVLTLRVKDSSMAGHRVDFHLTTKGNRRKLSSACWHVHGEFFDALNKEAEIVTLGNRTSPGREWADWNAGGIYMSDLCDCY